MVPTDLGKGEGQGWGIETLLILYKGKTDKKGAGRARFISLLHQLPTTTPTLFFPFSITTHGLWDPSSPTN